MIINLHTSRVKLGLNVGTKFWPKTKYITARTRTLKLRENWPKTRPKIGEIILAKIFLENDRALMFEIGYTNS